jgi:hypothetical protein
MSSCSIATTATPLPEDTRMALVCGSEWQDAYAALHTRLLTTRSPRLLVFDAAANGGLADRLTGLMTVLLFAILTDRALAIDWPGHTEAFGTPRVNVAAALKLAKQAPASEVRRIRWLNSNRLTLREQVETDLDALWPERVLIFQSNRGFSQGLLNSTRHAPAVAARHLTPTTAQFGCLVNFLIRPTEAALERVAPLRDALAMARARAAVTIGVHVRTGDASFDDEAGAGGAKSDEARRGAELYEAHAFIFEYATRLGKQLMHARAWPMRGGVLDSSADADRSGGAGGSAGGSVGAAGPYYVLLGDSPALRRHAAATLGEHSVLYWGNSTGAATVGVGHVARQPGDVATLQSAVGEHWLYTGCDSFVFSSHSGYPRTAAARALRDDAMHTCFHYDGPLFNSAQRSTARECSGPWSVAALGDRHAAGL